MPIGHPIKSYGKNDNAINIAPSIHISCIVRIKKVSGTADERITIRGAGGRSGRDSVVLRGAGDSSRVFQLMHEYYTLEVRGSYNFFSFGTKKV